jgi:hypothetical protein
VTATAQINPSYHSQVAVSVMQSDGTSTMLLRSEPYALLRAQQAGELKMSYGYKGAVKVGRLSVSEDLLQVKGINFGLTGQIDTDGATFYGVGVSYKWM